MIYKYSFEYDDGKGNKGSFHTNSKYDFEMLMESKIKQGCKVTYEEY